MTWGGTKLLALVGVVLMLGGALVGCGGGGSSTSSASSTEAATTSTTPTTPKARGVYVIAEPYQKPKNPGPHPGARVDSLIVKDIKKGTGAQIHAGDSGIFDFIATNYVTGRAIESSWVRRRPFETRIDHGVVIDGWWQGIPGMRVGGERQLVIPPSLGFTQSGYSPEVASATIYYDVVLLGVRPAQGPGVGGAQTTSQ